jgi:hypothetical protein
MLRRVALPSGIEGSLLLHAMPGRGEPLKRTWHDLADARVDVIEPLQRAERVVSVAGSSPMSPELDGLVAWYASRSIRA